MKQKYVNKIDSHQKLDKMKKDVESHYKNQIDLLKDRVNQLNEQDV